VFGHGLEECLDKCMSVLRKVFDELICYRVRSGCLSGWGMFDCSVVVAFSDVFV